MRQVYVLLLWLMIAAPAYANINSELLAAAEKGDLSTVKTLFEIGAGAGKKRIKDGQTALALAARKGHIDIVRFLLAKGVDINARDDAGTTALMWAAIEGDNAEL